MEIEDLIFFNINPLNKEQDEPTSDTSHSDGIEAFSGMNACTSVMKTRRKQRSSVLNWEMEQIDDISVKKFKCKLCSRLLSTKELLRKHILSKHLKLKPFECDSCPKKFTFAKSLLAHREIHSEEAKYVCICGKSYKVQSSYIDHIKRIHQAVSDVPFTCNVCSKSFVDRQTLRIHLSSVHKEKTIQCSSPNCNKLFSTISLMHSHYRCHSKEEFICSECGNGFKTESYLKKHQLNHKGIRPFKCTECSKSYLSVSHLNQHRKRAHFQRSSFQCSICGKCFNAKEQMISHEDAHVGDKKFACDICDYKTSYRCNLCTHKKRHLSTEKIKKVNHQKVDCFDDFPSQTKRKNEIIRLSKKPGTKKLELRLVKKSSLKTDRVLSSKPKEPPSSELNLSAWDDLAEEENLFGANSPSHLLKSSLEWDQEWEELVKEVEEVVPFNTNFGFSNIKRSNVTLNCAALDVPYEKKDMPYAASPFEF